LAAKGLEWHFDLLGAPLVGAAWLGAFNDRSRQRCLWLAGGQQQGGEE